MIKLIDKGPDASRIEFTPIHGSRSRAVTRDLIFGHRCHWCQNVVTALFLTPEQIDLRPYEETRVISQGDKNAGELLKIIPNLQDPLSSYRQSFYPSPAGKAQYIRLKNHVLRWESQQSGNDKYYEPGERCCRYVGFDVLDPSKAVVELATIVGYNFGQYAGYVQPVSSPTIEFLADFKPESSYQAMDIRVLKVTGRGLPLLLLNRSLTKADTNADYGFSNLFEQWNKKVKQETAAAAALNAAQPEGELV